MPLIQFSVNTRYTGTTQLFPEGVDFDGSFRLRHYFKDAPHPETEYTLKHIEIDSGGTTFSRAKRHCFWVDFKFPQLNDAILEPLKEERPVVLDDGKPHLNDFGSLRFPITSFPVDGFNTEDSRNSNQVIRASSSQPAPIAYSAKGNHDMNIPLGRIRVEDGFLDCIVRGFDSVNSILTESSGGNRKCRIKQIQVILEYK